MSFGEKDMEYSRKQQQDVPVWKSPKYIEARNKAEEIIKSKKYDLNEGDFWILMNETQTGKMQYSGLIISHNGCLKINDKLENKFKTDCIEIDKEGYRNSLVYTYKDEDVYEVGEVSAENCKNAYPYAMALKRCFDRVVLKKCKLAYDGIYSDSEADEFTKKDEDELINDVKIQAFKELVKNKNVPMSAVKTILKKYGYDKLDKVVVTDYGKVVNEVKNWVPKK